MKLALALTIALMPTAALAEDYVGRWAAEKAWCANSPEDTDQVSVRIDADAMHGYENRCEFTDVTRNGSTFGITMVCASEGEVYDDAMELAVMGDTMIMDGAIRLHRCPE